MPNGPAVIPDGGMAAHGRGVPDPERLRALVAAVLPDYMVPAAVVVLESLPLLSNGKLDRAALPVPYISGNVGRKPEGALEERLAAVVADVLGMDEIGADDDFFAHGGDSLLAMRLVSRARTAGLTLTPREIFQHRTVAALARAITTEGRSSATSNRAAVAQAHEATGEELVPLTPIMHDLRERGGPIDGYHQSALLQTPPGLDEPTLTTILRTLAERHLMLRARLDRSDNWSLLAPSGPDAATWLTRVEAAPDPAISGPDAATWLTRVEAAPDSALIRQWGERAQAELDPEAGRMVRAVWFDAGPGTPGRLLLVIHHLVVDGVSWRALLPDLAAAWRGEPLAPVEVPFSRWSRALATRAVDPATVDELPYWTSVLAGRTTLAVDPARDVSATAREVSVKLGARETEALLTRVPAAFAASVNDILLTALARAMGDGVLVDLEGHGRVGELLGDADLSRTVGWFTSVVPVRLDTGQGTLPEAVARIRTQLAAPPASGIGYGLLRHLNPATAPALAALPRPGVQFNYLGRFGVPEATDWSYAPEAADLPDHPDLPLSHALTLTALTEDGCQGPRLTATWSYASRLLTEEEVRTLADRWLQTLHALVDLTDKRGNSA